MFFETNMAYIPPTDQKQNVRNSNFLHLRRGKIDKWGFAQFTNSNRESMKGTEILKIPISIIPFYYLFLLKCTQGIRYKKSNHIKKKKKETGGSLGALLHMFLLFYDLWYKTQQKSARAFSIKAYCVL